MSSPIGDASVRITAETAPFDGALRKMTSDARSSGDRAGDGFKGAFTRHLGGIAAAVSGAFAAIKVGGFLKDSIQQASSFGESLSKANVVFGESAPMIEAWSKTAATSLGQSQQQALEAAGTFGNLFTALKIGQAPAAEMSTKLVGLAGDLASFNNVSPEDALLALRSGLTGETEPLKKFGVNLNDATLKAKAMELGLNVGKGTLDANVKAQAAYALILEQTTTAQGDFARTSGGLANQQRILSARFKDMKRGIGEALLPITIKLVGFLSTVAIPIFGKLATAGTKAVDSLITWLGPKLSPVLDTAKLGLAGLVSAFKGEGVTSDGFVGVMERIGVAGRSVVEWFKANWPAIQDVIGKVAGRIGEAVGAVAAWLQSIDWAAVFTQAKDWIMPVVDALVNVGLAVADLAGSVAEFIAGHWDQIRSAFETVADLARGALTTALNALAGIIRTVADNFSAFAPIILTVVGAVVAYKAALDGLDGVQEAIKTGQEAINAGKTIYHNLLRIGAAAQKAYTAAQWLLNAAMNANPIALIVIGIAALVAGFILAYKHIKPFHDAVNAIGEVIKNVVTGAINFFIDHWQLLAALLLGGPIGVAILFIIQHFTGLKDAVVGAVTTVLGWLGNLLGFFISLPGSILGAIGDFAGLLLSKGIELMTGLYNGIVSAVGTVIGWFAGLAGMVLGWIGDATSWLLGTGAQIFAGMLSGLYSAESTIVGFFLGLPGNIISWVGDLGGVLVDAGKAVLRGLWDGIASMFGWLGDQLGGVGGFIADHKGPLSKDRKILHPAGRAIMEGLMDGIDGATPQLASQLSGVSALIGGTRFGFGSVGGGYGLPGGPGAAYRPGGGAASVNNSRTWQSGAVQINIPAQGSPQATAMAVSRRLAMGVAA